MAVLISLLCHLAVRLQLLPPALMVRPQFLRAISLLALLYPLDQESNSYPLHLFPMEILRNSVLTKLLV